MISRSPEETYQIGQELAKSLRAGDVLHFSGTLGAGKTTLIQGLVHALTGHPHTVVSPTFIYVNLYEGTLPVSHFDLYRLSSEEEFYAKALDEYIQPQGISCIEWPEKVPSLKGSVSIQLNYLDKETRNIEIHRHD